MELRRAVPADAPRMQYVAELAYAPYVERMAGVLPGPLRTGYVETHRGGEPGLERVFYEKQLDPPPVVE